MNLIKIKKFKKMNNSVKTASAPKVRKKIYQDSSEVWKHYEEYLQPLVNGIRK